MVGRQRLRGGGWGAENCGPQGMCGDIYDDFVVQSVKTSMEP